MSGPPEPPRGTPHPSAALRAAPLRKARFPIGLKLGLLATFLAIVPLTAVGYALIEVNVEAVRELSRGTQLLALGDLSQTIDHEFAEAEDALATAGSLFANPELDDATRLSVIQALVEGEEALDHVGLYDASGKQVVVIEEEGLEEVRLPAQLDPELRAAVDVHHAATGPVTRSGTGARAVSAVRIRVGERTTGYVISAISLEAVQQRVERLAEGHFNGVPNALFVVDSTFHVVAHVDREQAVARVETHDGILEGVTAEMLGPRFSVQGEFAAADGTPMLGSTAGIEGRPWALVAQVPQAIAYASLERMKMIVAGTIALAILLALILGLLTARGISAPLRALTAYARALAERRFDERVEVKTRDELAILGDAMSQAASDLQASEVLLRKEVAIRTDLGRYIPEKLVDQIVAREQAMELGGRKRRVTVMFADVVGFTKFTSQLAPEHVVAILNELFSILTEIVFKHDGTVDKFVGDCVMALWGAPADQADQTRRALEAAEDMLDWLETGNERWQEQYGVTVELAIGIHVGDAVVGNIGSERRMEYTAIGDTVNLAARLEAVARPNQILVTDAVKAAAGGGFEFADADLHRLAGWVEPVHLWEVRV